MLSCVSRYGGWTQGKALGSIIILNKKCANQIIESKRGMPARGTKPLPRYLWDKRHLEELTNGKYTHLPLRVNRLGGRDPITGHKVF